MFSSYLNHACFHLTGSEQLLGMMQVVQTAPGNTSCRSASDPSGVIWGMKFQGSYAVHWPRLLYDSSQSIPPVVPSSCSCAPSLPTTSWSGRLLSVSRMTADIPGNSLEHLKKT
jgi:hypothetical protein